MTAYDFFKDQGSIIAGIMALVAGGLAYKAGLAQARAVEKQNAELIKIERERIAHAHETSIRLLDGVLLGIDQDIEREISVIGNRSGSGSYVDPTLIEGSWRGIQKPEISIVWEQLGSRDPEWIKSYMLMNREIAQAWSRPKRNDITANDMLNDLRTLQQAVKQLRGSLPS